MAYLARCIRVVPASYGRPAVGLTRSYASQALGATSTSSRTTRKPVTVTNDDGRVPWGQLTGAEKVARTTQQTVNFSVIIIGALATGGVAYLLWDQVFSTDSKVAHFNRAFEELKESEKIIELLGPANQLRAHGDTTWNKWTRNRAIAATVKQDGAGRDHLMLHFFVEGPKNRGVVKLHMVRPDVNSAYVYKTFTVDVPGYGTIYLRNENTVGEKKKGMKFLGIQWS